MSENHDKKTRKKQEPEETGAEQEKPVETPEKTPEQQIAELQQTVRELSDKLLYLQADYQNYRKRTAKDLSDARIGGTAAALEPFLRVNDFLGMARTAAEKSGNVEAIRQGILMIIAEYDKAMNELGVSRIKSVGEKFDPELHDALSSESSETVPENVVIREFSGGYRMGERLLRPARVVVSTGRPVPETPESPAAPDAQDVPDAQDAENPAEKAE